MMNFAPQVDRLIENMGSCLLNDDETFAGSSKLMSLLFGYKLIDLAMVSLCATVRSRGLLPGDVSKVRKIDTTQEQAQLLYEYGVIDFVSYERVIRVLNSRPQVNLELANLSNSFPLFDELLDDVSSILRTTESVVNELCDRQEPMPA